MLTDKELENSLNNLPGERMTADYIRSRIKSVGYSTLPKSTFTLCNIAVDNGFSVRGESTCAQVPGRLDLRPWKGVMPVRSTAATGAAG
jgi:Phage protein (N4 Gp49/phage Sf6 gene 66) family